MCYQAVVGQERKSWLILLDNELLWRAQSLLGEKQGLHRKLEKWIIAGHSLKIYLLENLLKQTLC